MPTDSPAKPKRVTWLDWQPPDSPEPADLMTRDEFVQRLRAIGVDVDEGDVRFWEYHGILPRAVKKWQGGATRTFYPRWMLHTVAELRALQDIGYPLERIRPRLRNDAWLALRRVGKVEDAERAGAIDRASGDAILKDLADRVRLEVLQADMLRLAERFARLTGREDVATVEVGFRDPNGQMINFYPVDVGTAAWLEWAHELGDGLDDFGPANQTKNVDNSG